MEFVYWHYRAQRTWIIAFVVLPKTGLHHFFWNHASYGNFSRRGVVSPTEETSVLYGRKGLRNEMDIKIDYNNEEV